MKLPRSYSLKEIASLINAKFSGNENFAVTGINEIHMVEAGDLTFVDHPKYYDKSLTSAATTILINKEVECPAGKALLFSDDPFRDYNFLTKHFSPNNYSKEMVSKSAVVGEGSNIMPNVFLGNDVRVGKNCVLYPGVVVYDGCTIGNNVIIHANTVIGADAFYYKKRPEFYEKMHSCGSVIIEDDVEIGAMSTIDKGVSGNTVIGKGSKLDNHVHVGHDTVIGKNCLFAAQVGIAGVVKIEDNVTMWGQVGVRSDIVIEKGAVVLAQSGVGQTLKAGKTYFGSPAEEAREKMKEIAALKYLPDLIKKKS
jgi:UDP-3-O-[3-hydroxymyristoyl] glucosamine N-acyltransferase